MTADTPASPEPSPLIAPRPRGSFIVRQLLKRVVLRQNPAALKAAGRMALLLPIVQAALQVLVLKAEPWQGLLALEGLLIGWLAASQLSRPDPENRWLGLGVALFNIAILCAAGVYIGGHMFWITGLATALPIAWLVIFPTYRWSVPVAWAAMAGPILALALVAGAARLALEQSVAEQDPAARLALLDRAFMGLRLRGDNGAERALMRVRQAQAAQAAGEYERAWRYADDGLFDQGRNFRAIPESYFARDLIDSLLSLKAANYYNAQWDQTDELRTRIKADPLDEETRNEPASPIRWGW